MSDIDLHALSQCYGRVFAGCTLVVPGANRTYHLTADVAAYYLRLYRTTSRFAADGMDCTHMPFEGVNCVAGLFHALEGWLVADDPENVALLGSALARLHVALAGIGAGRARPLDLATLCAYSVVSLARIPGGDAAGHAVKQWRTEILSDPATHDLPSGNRHGDARLANAVARNSIIGFFDFEDCDYGPYVLDLGTAAWHFVRGDPAETTALIAVL